MTLPHPESCLLLLPCQARSCIASSPPHIVRQSFVSVTSTLSNTSFPCPTISPKLTGRDTEARSSRFMSDRSHAATSSTALKFPTPRELGPDSAPAHLKPYTCSPVQAMTRIPSSRNVAILSFNRNLPVGDDGRHDSNSQVSRNPVCTIEGCLYAVGSERHRFQLRHIMRMAGPGIQGC